MKLDSGDYRQALTAAWRKSAGKRNPRLQGRLIDGRHHGLAIGCFIEGGACRPEGDRAARDQCRRHASPFSSVPRRSARASRRCLPRSRPMRSKCRWIAFASVRHGSTAYVSDGYGAYHSRSIVMGGSALLDAASNLQALVRATAASRLGCAEQAIMIDAERVAGPAGKALSLSQFAGLTAEGILHQQEAHLHLRHPCGPHHGGRADRGHRDCRLCGRGRLRPHHQPDDAARSGDRLAGAGPRRRHAGASRL